MSNIDFCLFADAGNGIGTGHIYRVYPLYRRALEGGYSAKMIIPLPEERISHLGLHGISSISDDQMALMKEVKRLKPSILILDSYRLSAHSHELSIQDTGTNLVIFDDHYKAVKQALVVINASPLACPSCYSDYPIDRLLLGPQYASFADEFSRSRQNYVLKKNIQRVLVALGGEDSMGRLDALLSAVQQITASTDILVEVIGNRMPKKAYSSNIRYIGWLDNNELAHTMTNYDLALLSGGSMIYQVLCVGVPTITWPQTPAQKKHSQGWEATGSIRVINEPDELPDAFDHILHAKKNMFKTARSLVDGKGATRIMNRLLQEKACAD